MKTETEIEEILERTEKKFLTDTGNVTMRTIVLLLKYILEKKK